MVGVGKEGERTGLKKKKTGKSRGTGKMRERTAVQVFVLTVNCICGICRYIEDNYSKIRNVERELASLAFEIKLTAGPKKAGWSSMCFLSG